MAQKLGIPFTNDLLALGSNSAISDALIEKAVAAGKTEEQINAAMASLWLFLLTYLSNFNLWFLFYYNISILY